MDTEKVASAYQEIIEKAFPGVDVRLRVFTNEGEDIPMVDAFCIPDERLADFVCFLFDVLPGRLSARKLPHYGVMPHDNSATKEYYPEVWRQHVMPLVTYSQKEPAPNVPVYYLPGDTTADMKLEEWCFSGQLDEVSALLKWTADSPHVPGKAQTPSFTSQPRETAKVDHPTDESLGQQEADQLARAA